MFLAFFSQCFYECINFNGINRSCCIIGIVICFKNIIVEKTYVYARIMRLLFREIIHETNVLKQTVSTIGMNINAKLITQYTFNCIDIQPTAFRSLRRRAFFHMLKTKNTLLKFDFLRYILNLRLTNTVIILQEWFQVDYIG